MTTQPTPADQLAEIVPLAEELGWMPEGVLYVKNFLPEVMLKPSAACILFGVRMKDEHAFYIIKGTCEDRLIERGWFRNANLKWVHIEDYKELGEYGDDEIEHSLPDAMQAEIERTKNLNT